MHTHSDNTDLSACRQLSQTHTHTHRPRHHSPYEADDPTPVFRSFAAVITLIGCRFSLHI